MLEIRNNSKLLASLLGGKPATAADETKKPSAAAAHAKPSGKSDAVELSSAAQTFEPRPIDIAQKIARIRDLIAKDEYLTEDKLDVVAQKLQAELSQRPPRARIAS
ncbi:MAG: hypothetical protein SF069_08150 [Phycisphaerae bacterium]|nr:hypothetical protein [Phycisphaerae bacterium]